MSVEETGKKALDFEDLAERLEGFGVLSIESGVQPPLLPL